MAFRNLPCVKFFRPLPHNAMAMHCLQPDLLASYEHRSDAKHSELQRITEICTTSTPRAHNARLNPAKEKRITRALGNYLQSLKRAKRATSNKFEST